MRGARRATCGLAAAVLLGAGCGGGAAPPAPAPQRLLAEAREQFRSGDFAKAQLGYQRLIFELPQGSDEQAEARYYLAETHFQLGQFVEAADEFLRVGNQYATSRFAPTALLRAGDAHLRLWRRPELDPTHGETALALYQELTGRFPDTQAAQRAQLHVVELRGRFAEKAYRNGLFYMQRRAFDSAIIYFKDVVARFPDTPWAALALLRLADTYRTLEYAEELEETCDHVRRFYPNVEGLGESCPPAPAAGAR
jgi:outer membrane protein assembly factor BamD